MKRSTLIMLAVLAALLAVYFVAARKPQSDAPPPLSIDGYIGNVSEQEARSAVNARTPPVTHIVLKRKDEEIVLDRVQAPDPPLKEGEKPKEGAPPPAEAKWVAKRTYKGKTTEAKVQAFRAQTMSETFARSIRSTYSVPVTPAQLAEYGLDPDHAVDVELTVDGKPIKLRLGQLDKAEQAIESNTWVANPALPGVAYQVAQRDLRTSFDVSWSDLRDRSVLTLDLPKVERIEIENPADPKVKKVVAVRSPLAADKKDRPAEEGWAIQEPAGTVPGDTGDWLKAIERFSVSEFLDPADLAAKKVDTGLDDPNFAARVTVVAGKDKTVLTFGRTDESKPNKETYARIEGRDEVYLVAGYSRDQIVQTLDQLRDRRLLGLRKGKDVTAFTLTGPRGKVHANRNGGAWVVAEPAQRTHAKAIEDFLADLDTMKVDFLAEEATASNGLDAPEWTLQLQIGAETLAIQLGKEVDGNTYGRSGAAAGAGQTWKLGSWNAGRLKKSAADFADKHLVSLAKDDVTEIWRTPATGDALHLVRGADGTWLAESGTQKAPAKAEAVAGVVASATSLEWAAEHADKKPGDVGLEKDHEMLRIRDKSGAEVEIRISSQKSGDDFYAGIAQGGKVGRVVTISAAATSAFQKTYEDLTK